LEAEWCWEYDWGGCEIVTRWWVLWVRMSEPVVRWSGSAKGMSCGSYGSVGWCSAWNLGVGEPGE